MKDLSKNELVEIQGGEPTTAAVIGLSILAAAIYDMGGSFLAGAFNPYTSNEE